jgi:transposase
MKKFGEILKCSSLEVEAAKITHLEGLNHNAVVKYLLLIRKRIAEECEMKSPIFGDIEVDERIFGARQVKGERGCGARGKTIVFELIKRNGRVYTKIVLNYSRGTLEALIRGKVDF